jgi:NADPH:quinone reductase-like Zn-dependent oxidoreductase
MHGHALLVRDRNSPDAEYEEVPMPEPGIGDVLLAVEAASFTPTELAWPSTWVDRAGRDRSPVVPGHEVSGTIAALGYGTTGFAIGDAVYGMTDWYRDGALADYVAVEARNLARRPASISPIDSASLPLAGLTAWQGLFVHGNLQRDQKVVINGATGGVGSLAIQLARWAGARVTAVAHAWGRQLLDDLGADVFVDAEAIPAGIGDSDLLFDTVGGDLAHRCLGMLGPGGVVVSVVDSEPEAPKAGRATFFVVEPDRDQLDKLARLVDEGRVRPIVGEVIDLAARGKQGFETKGHGGVPGKIVVTPGHPLPPTARVDGQDRSRSIPPAQPASGGTWRRLKQP